MHRKARTLYTSLIIITALICGGTSVRANRFIDNLPHNSTLFTGSWHPDSVKVRMATMPLTAVEGLWRMSDNGALLAIEQYSDPLAPVADTAGNYRIVMVQSPTRHPRPGTLVGYASATAKSGVYEARIYTALTDRLLLERPRKFILRLNPEENRFTMTPVKSGLKISLWRLIPYMFRFSVRTGSNRPDDIDGCLRVYPQSDAEPLNPRYL